MILFFFSCLSLEFHNSANKRFAEFLSERRKDWESDKPDKNQTERLT